MTMSQAEKAVFCILFNPDYDREALITWICAYLGNPTAEFVERQKLGEIALLKYIQHHIHLVPEKDLQDFLDENSNRR